MDTQSMVAEIAPLVDALVFSIGPTVSDEDRNRLREATARLGWSDTGYLVPWAEFLQTGLDPAVAELRKPYAADGELRDWFDRLRRDGLVEAQERRLVATGALIDAINTITTAEINATNILWGDHLDEVDLAIDLVGRVAAGVTPDHAVAVAHRDLPDPEDRCLMMRRRLVTMRYIRQHDHRMAWIDAGLSKEQIVALTELWHGGVVDDDDVMADLVQRGLATASGVLTDHGQRVRDDIEAETNRRNAEDFAVLNADQQAALLAALQALATA